MQIVIADSDSRRRDSIAAALPPHAVTVKCGTLASLKRALAGPAPKAVVIGPLPGGHGSVISAIRQTQSSHPKARLFYLADALPGLIPSAAKRHGTEYLPPLMSGARIASAVLESIRNSCSAGDHPESS